MSLHIARPSSLATAWRAFSAINSTNVPPHHAFPIRQVLRNFTRTALNARPNRAFSAKTQLHARLQLTIYMTANLDWTVPPAASLIDIRSWLSWVRQSLAMTEIRPCVCGFGIPLRGNGLFVVRGTGRGKYLSYDAYACRELFPKTFRLGWTDVVVVIKLYVPRWQKWLKYSSERSNGVGGLCCVGCGRVFYLYYPPTVVVSQDYGGRTWDNWSARLTMNYFRLTYFCTCL